MTDKQLWERLHKNAEWARGNEWETPLCLADDLTAAADAIERLQNEAEGMRSNWSKSVITIKRLQSELTQEKIDNTNLIGELATVAAERDRYKAEHENPQPLTLEEVKEHITKGHPNDIKPLYVDFKPTIPIDYTSRWRDAYNLSRLIAGRGDEYGKTWLAYRSKPKEGNT